MRYNQGIFPATLGPYTHSFDTQILFFAWPRKALAVVVFMGFITFTSSLKTRSCVRGQRPSALPGIVPALPNNFK
jgi:hypothetical protein